MYNLKNRPPQCTFCGIVRGDCHPCNGSLLGIYLIYVVKYNCVKRVWVKIGRNIDEKRVNCRVKQDF